MFCGAGCRLKYVVEDGKIVQILPDPQDPASEGKPCIKGLSIHTLRPKRVEYPLVRETDGEFSRVSWEYALDLIVDRLENTAPGETGWVGSGEITNEDNYLIQKFAREVIGSDNVDSCARLCHAPTVKAYKEMFGIPASPDYENDIYGLDLLIVVGTNPASNYPTIFSKIMAAKAHGLKLLTINIWYDETAQFSDYKVIVKPGRMAFVVMGILHELIFTHKIHSNVPGFDELKHSVIPYDPNTVEEITGVPAEQIKELGRIVAEAEKVGVMHGMKYTQTYHGTDAVKALTAIAVLKNGKVVTGRGKINIQGAGDVGIAPRWGKTLTEFMVTDPVKFVFISQFNPARSLPALGRAWNNMKRAFIVHATPVLNATTEFADIVLPTPLLYEREGTVTTGERRVRLVRCVVPPPREARQEWQFFQDLAHRLGEEWKYRSPKDVFYEITEKVDGYMHIDPDAVYSGEDAFAEKGARHKKLCKVNLHIVEHPGYKYTLFTARRMPHFNTGDLTTTSERLSNMFSSRAIWLNPRDAKSEGLKEGDHVRLVSPEGELEAEVHIEERVLEGVVATTFHFEDSPVNVLTPLDLDADTKIPSYKTVPVRIEKI